MDINISLPWDISIAHILQITPEELKTNLELD